MCGGEDQPVTSGQAGPADATGSNDATITEASASADATRDTSATSVDAGCFRATPPLTALSATSHSFDTFTSSSADPAKGDVWKHIGYDRDGHCTTAASTDVCIRFMNAPASAQEDGDQGIDNAWGHFIAPVLDGFGSKLTKGFLKTDASGSGVLVLESNGALRPANRTSQVVVTGIRTSELDRVLACLRPQPSSNHQQDCTDPSQRPASAQERTGVSHGFLLPTGEGESDRAKHQREDTDDLEDACDHGSSHGAQLYPAGPAGPNPELEGSTARASYIDLEETS